ncbi:MAG: thioredoxin domain-containing protein [Pseudomonadota bacterium]
MKRLLLGLAVLLAAPVMAAPAKKAAPVRRSAPVTWINVVAPTPAGGMRMGNPSAPVKLVEYGSRACPYCARFGAEGVPALKAGYIATGKVSYEFRDFPVHGPLDLGPILLGWCVSPARFFTILDQMFANQPTLLAREAEVSAKVQARTGATPNQVAIAYAEGLGYIAFMKARGLPEPKARACLADRRGIDRIVAMTRAATTKYNVGSTPTFLINGNPTGASDWASLEPLLRAAGA